MKIILTTALCFGTVATLSAQLPRLEEQVMPASLIELSAVPDTTVGIAVHPSGCLLFADASDAKLDCVDLRSGITREIGRKGAGPREFGRITALAIAPTGDVLVEDAGNHRLTRVDHGLQVGESITLSGPVATGLFRPTADSVYMLGGPRGWDLAAVSLRTGSITPRFSPGATDSSLFDMPAYHTWGFFLQSGRNGGWLVASVSRNAVLALDSNGHRTFLASRDLPPELPSPAEQQRRREQNERLNPGLTPEQRTAMNGTVDRYSKAPKATTLRQGFGQDAEGRLWVMTQRIRSDSTELDVFAANGRFLGTRRVSGRVQAIAFHDNDLLVLGEYLGGPHDGFQGVRRFRIR